MKDDEKAAEESAKGWIKFAEEMVPLTTIEVDTMLLLVKKSFLAGCKHARTPIKIDPKDESSWPPKDCDFIYEDLDGFWTLTNWGLQGGITMGRHWLPLPTIKEGEE